MSSTVKVINVLLTSKQHRELAKLKEAHGAGSWTEFFLMGISQLGDPEA